VTELVLTLPAPPSVNNLFATVGKRRIRSKRYQAWVQEAWLAAQQQKRDGSPVFRTPVSVEIEHERRSRRTDLDNLSKAPLDFLVSMQYLADDSLVECITARWSDTVKGMQITVRAGMSEVIPTGTNFIPSFIAETPGALLSTGPEMPILGGRMNTPTLSRCLEIVAEATGLTTDELVSRTRRRAIARPRQIAMWLAHNFTSATTTQISIACGIPHDRKSVLHACRKVESLCESDAGFRTLCHSLIRLVAA
jgi:Holliday junction resolvase RusA-like endonuclease